MSLFDYAHHHRDIPFPLKLPAPMSVSKYGRKLNYLGFLVNEPQLCEVSNATYQPMLEFNFLTSHKLQVQAQVSLQYLGYRQS